MTGEPGGAVHHRSLTAGTRTVGSEVQKRSAGSSRTPQLHNGQQTGHPPCLRQSHYSSTWLCTYCSFFFFVFFFFNFEFKMVSSRLAAKGYNLMQVFLFPYIPCCRLLASHLSRCAFAFSVPPCFSPHLSWVSLVYREFEECGLGARRLPQTRSALGSVLPRQSGEHPSGPPEVQSKGGHSPGRKSGARRRVWKTLVMCF